MSDHIDGPRTTADPSIDLSDLFAFTSPADPKRTVLIADAFPFAGETALFSNAVDHSMVMRRARVAGVGDNAAFKTEGPEIRFTFQFDVLKPGPNGERMPQTGACKLPDGQTLGDRCRRRARCIDAGRRVPRIRRAADRIRSSSAGGPDGS